MSSSDIVLSTAGTKSRYVATLCPSKSRWYEQFTMGISARMGNVFSQDKAYTIEVIYKLLSEYEQEWATHDFNMDLKAISMCMFLLVSSLGGVHGFEVMWTDLDVVRFDLNFCKEQEVA